MKKVLIWVMMFIISLFSVYGLTCSNTIFYEGFDYSDNYANHGWNVVSASTPPNSTPLEDTYSFGFNGTNAGGSVESLIYRNINTTTGQSYTIKYKIISLTDSVASNSIFTVQLTDSNLDTLRLHIRQGGTNDIGVTNNLVGGDGCSDSFKTFPFVATDVDLLINPLARTYSVLVDDAVKTGCEDVELSTNTVINITQIQISNEKDAGETLAVWSDDLTVCNVGAEEVLASSCTHPLVFCDNFNYDTPLFDNDWKVLDPTGEVNLTFTPIDSVLNLDIPNRYLDIEHATFFFDTYYPIDSETIVQKSLTAPVFASEFQLLLINNTVGNATQCLGYEAFDSNKLQAYSLRFCPNGSIWRERADNPDGSHNFTKLCDDCITADNVTYNHVKIISYFQQNKYFDHFNSTAPFNGYKVFIDGTAYDGNAQNEINFMHNVFNLQFYKFSKNNKPRAKINDYFVMVGTSKNYDNAQEYVSVLYNFENTTANYQESTGDLSSGLFSIYDVMGLKTKTSRYLSGIFLTFLFAIVVLMTSIAYKVQLSPAIYLISVIVFMIFMIFIKLLPVWIPFVLALIGAGLGALYVKSHAG